MKRHIPGLHSRQQDHENLLEGLFLVRVDAASYRWHPQKPFLSDSGLSFSNPKRLRSDHFQVGSIAPNEPSGN